MFIMICFNINLFYCSGQYQLNFSMLVKMIVSIYHISIIIIWGRKKFFGQIGFANEKNLRSAATEDALNNIN